MIKKFIGKIIKYNLPLIDFFLSPLVLISAIYLKLIRKAGVLSGDAEFLYNIIRYFQPQKLIEIGSGMST